MRSVFVYLFLFCVSVALFYDAEGAAPNRKMARKPQAARVCPKNHSHLKVIKNRQVCVPHCPKGCHGGTCRPDKSCACKKGFKAGPHGRQCLPQCQACVNGYCTGPNVCKCKEGFRKAKSGKCLPVCPGGCQKNAECMQGRGCRCKTGFRATIDGECTPKCVCPNGKCKSPGVCECNKGFTKDEDGDCVKIATGGGKGKGSSSTSNAMATANANANVHIIIEDKRTGILTDLADDCPAGHTKFGEECVPACRRCANGRCTAPNVCTCNEGFLYDSLEQSCFPKCDHPCANGVCSAPNQCTCRTGFIRDEVDPFICLPHCSPLCANGYCIGNNQCECLSGYKKGASGCEVDVRMDVEEDPLEKWAAFVQDGDMYDIDVRMGEEYADHDE